MHEYLEEIQDERGYLYYYNKNKNMKYKENPRLILILDKLKDLDGIKFCTYRSACKILKLQKELFTYYIPFEIVKKVLKLHRFDSYDDSPLLRPNEVTALIHDIFFAAEKLELFKDCQNFELKSAVSVLSNLIWNVYDNKRSTSISLMELKLTLLVLCELPGNYNDIKKEHFQLVKNHNGSVSSIRFESLLNIFGKLLSYLGETLYFEAKVIQEIIQDCYSSIPGPSGLNEYQFIELWNLQNPTRFSHYTTIFILLIRIKKSENVVHENQCTGCHVFPIKGIRFMCTKCKNLNLCFNCFTKGFRNKKHTFGHRMFELNSVEPPHRGKLYNLFQKIRSLFSRNINMPISNLNHETFNTTKFIENDNIQLMKVEDVVMDTTNKSKMNEQPITPMNQDVFTNSQYIQIIHQKLVENLNNAIEILTTQAHKFDTHLEANKQYLEGCDNGAFYEYATEHKIFLTNHMNLLKQLCDTIPLSSLKNGTLSRSNGLNLLPYSSTPYRQPNKSQNMKATGVSSPMQKSIHGAEVNKTYLDENKCDYSVSDMSSWFQTKATIDHQRKPKELDLKTIDDVALETEMTNFRDLLLKVKEIIDDSYSDNLDLAKTTHQLENVLHRIIDDEEKKRIS